MINKKWIEAIINQYILSPQTYNPTIAYQTLHSGILEQCQQNGQFNPWIETDAMEACNLIGSASNELTKYGYLSAAINLIVSAWNHLSELQQIQRDTNVRIYKAGLGFYLSRLFYRERDIGGAIRWALLTHADDALAKHYNGSGAHILQQSLGFSDDAFTALNEIANRNRAEKRWTHKSHFPEDVLVEFLLVHPEYSFWLTQPTTIIEHSISKAYFKALRQELENAIKSKDYKKVGECFEDLATYLMLLIPNWIPQRNVSPVEKSFEHDIVVTNMMRADNLEVDLYGRDILVECKYLGDPLTASDVGYFLHRMHLTHTKFGIIFSRKGITGQDNDKYAQSQINHSYQKDKCICIVITDNDLNKLETGKVSFRAMLLAKVNHLKFGKAQSRDNKSVDID